MTPHLPHIKWYCIIFMLHNCIYPFDIQNHKNTKCIIYVSPWISKTIINYHLIVNNINRE
jgi:hypothetical protein